MRKFLYFIFTLFVSISCEAATTTVPTLELGECFIQSDYGEFYATVDVRSSEPYTVDLKSDWAAISDIKEGVDFDAITFHCDRNATPDARYAEAFINTDYASRRIYILQEAGIVDVEADSEANGETDGEANSETNSQAGAESGAEANSEAGSETIGETDSEVDTEASWKVGVEVVGNSLTAYLNEPGTLYKMCRKYFDYVDTGNEYGEQVWSNITNVTLYGSIDARDFSTLKWNFRNLKNVDLSGVKITAYSGEYGTNEGYYDGTSYSIYEANEVPIGAFFYWQENKIRNFPGELYDEGMASLRSVKLPGGIKAIRRNAFARAYNLKEINIPEGVEIIEMVAFRYCTSIEKLYLPSTIENIGWLAFTDMYSLKEVHIKARYIPSEDQSFGNYPDSDNRGYVVVGDVNYSEKTNAVLYVPAGCKANYKTWEKYFIRIVEE